jgi:7-cyano-7-deazaguanine synthase
MSKTQKHVVLSLSGGMDSSTLLLRCLKEYDTVTAISFDYGQKHRIELERAQSLVDYLNSNCDENDCYKGCKINYRQIKLDGLVDLLDSALVSGGDEVPEGHYEEDNMKATVVPNRNKIFSSIVQAVALSVANKTGETCDIALGIHAGDHDIYPDCRQEFRDADIFIAHTVTEDEVFGDWFADYKSASSVERVEAFLDLGRPDPIGYADENGPVEWDKVVESVSAVLTNYSTTNG